MPNIRVRVYNTQNNSYTFDQDVSVATFGEMKDLIGHNPSSRYTDKDDRSDPFLNEAKLVTKDVVIFESPSKSKAGMATFKEMLIRSNDSIKLDRADRLAKSAYRAQSKLVMDLEAKKDNIIEAIESSKDISTSNSKDTINTVEAFDPERWVSRYQQNSVELELVTKELEIATGNFASLFGHSVDEATGEVLQELPSDAKKK
jgi:hypothetical protein